ncbi:hypothetical protein HAX54_018594 [Datura stramonium]|uniref:FAF domain-containing protein n=1 Tax=Datura stramonium TaxID=4076 RepID=A0ABS8UQ04_DATST|nr:hypothetical protein [Datura stramonium]
MTTHQTESSSSSSTWSRNCREIKSSTSNKKTCSKFPPPLTTLRGVNSVQFKPHREDGRLIIVLSRPHLHIIIFKQKGAMADLGFRFFKHEISTSNFDENEDLEEIEDDMIESDIKDGDEEEEEIEEKEDDIEEEERQKKKKKLKKRSWIQRKKKATCTT